MGKHNCVLPDSRTSQVETTSEQDQLVIVKDSIKTAPTVVPMSTEANSVPTNAAHQDHREADCKWVILHFFAGLNAYCAYTCRTLLLVTNSLMPLWSPELLHTLFCFVWQRFLEEIPTQETELFCFCQ